METNVPRLSPSTHAHLEKIFNSLIISAFTGMYGAAWTTLIAVNVGSRLLSTDFYHDDTIHDMKVSAASMAALGMLSLPYQYTHDLPTFDHFVLHHPYWTLHLGLEAPIILPLIVNKMTRENDFTEFNSLVLGGVIMQLLVLGIIYSIFVVGLNNDRFISFLDYIAEWIFPDDPTKQGQQHAHRHHSNCRHARHQPREGELLPRQKSFSDALIKQSFATAKKLRETFALASGVVNPRMFVRNIDSFIKRPVVNYLQTARNSIMRDFNFNFNFNMHYFFNRIIRAQANHELGLESKHETGEQDKKENILIIPQAVSAVSSEVVTPIVGNAISLSPAAEKLAVTEIKFDLDEETIDVLQPLSSFPVGGVVNRKEKKPPVKRIKPKYQKRPAKKTVEQTKAQEKSERKLSDVIREISKKKSEEKPNEKPNEKPIEKPRLKLSDLRLVKTVFSPPAEKTESVQPLKVEKGLKVQLNDFENLVFNFLDTLVPTKDHNYKTYIVGGWAYDKVRELELGMPPCLYNDIDLVTEIPRNLLGGILNRIPQVNGLFCGTLHNIKMDVMHIADLSDLSSEVKNRDFMLFYIDKFGKVFDPTRRALVNLRLGRLDDMKPPELMFKEDPLVMLRAIYEGTKRNLNYDDLKSVMVTDGIALVPRNVDINGEPETILNPHRMNLRIGNLFSQHFAAKNFAILCDLGFFGVLYPGIYVGMIAALDWIKQQMANTAMFPKPSLALIYASFIAPTIVHQNPVLPYDNNDDRTKFDEDILRLVDAAGKTSLLFQDVFKSPHELYDELRWPLKMYRQFYLNKLLTVTPEAPAFTGMRNC